MKKLRRIGIQVFISSAMDKESGTPWLEIRKSIRDSLMKCDYLDPFIIEDNVTELPSIETFLFNIEKSDLVVFLVKDEIRPGTKQEIIRARELRKPMLVYFCKSDVSSKSIEDFRDELIKKDAVTFKNLPNFDNIDQIVLNDVINNIISYYQYKHNIELDVEDSDDELLSTDMLIDNSLLDKSSLNHFGSNQNSLIEFLDLSNYATINDEELGSSIAKKLLKWAFKGTDFITKQEMDDFFSELSLSEDTEKVLKLRFQATQKYFDGDLKGALAKSNAAYELGKELRVPNWLLSEILIDNRNIHGQMRYYETEYQQKLNESESFVHFPIADRFVKTAFEKLEQERFRIRNASAHTVHHGNTLLYSLQYIEKYLYISLVMGSSTHLLQARKKFTELLIDYGDLYNDENLIYQALKLYILSGDQKNFSKVLETDWNKVSNILAVNVKEVWNITDAKYCSNSIVLKCAITKSLGQYMNDNLFMLATASLVQYSSEFDSYEQGQVLLEAIDNNFKRFGNNYVLNMLLNILKSNKMLIYSRVTNLLSKIELSGCDDSDLKELGHILKTKISEILERNGNPEFIVNLLNQFNDIYSDLFDLISEKISQNTADIINIELGHYKNSKTILQNNIRILRERFHPDSSVYIGYADNPLGVIEYITEQVHSTEVFEVLNNEFIPLLIEVLSSSLTVETKQDYLKTLIELLTEYKRANVTVPKELIDFFSTKEIVLKNDWSMRQVSMISSLYYVNTIKSLLNLNSEDEILTFCVNYKQNSRSEREAFSYSIQKFIEYNISSNKTIPLFINLVVMDMLQDNYFMVRKNAIKCLMLLYSISPSEVLENELIRMTTDISPNVKFYYINQLNKQILDGKLTKNLLTLFAKDGSYGIRQESKHLLSLI
ncbi:hypothetical protein [Lactococcus formosensis]|uniref:Uncharacterized protein n=3 Tax=Lactococcus TaxID=1357 RepID=A0A9Q8Y1S0_9LACT|nr:hypothetical protein [Lactococcus formosensis]USJ19909.1 hypothetical protein LMK00_08730 [Lactococcus formosensis]